MSKEEEHPYLVLCVTKSKEKLESLYRKLKDNGIECKVFRDSVVSDTGEAEVTALATQPLIGEERDILKNYQLLKGTYN